MLLTGARTFKKVKHVCQLDEYFDDLREDLTNPSIAHQDLLVNPWLWWLQIGRTLYPVVFNMARDYLTVPSISCDFERAFSKACRTITSDRNALSSAIIEALQLQNWRNRRIVLSELMDLHAFLLASDDEMVDRNSSTNSQTSIDAEG